MKNITLTLKKQRYHLLYSKLSCLFRDYPVLSFYTSSSLGTDELLELKASLPNSAGILHIPTGILRSFLEQKCSDKSSLDKWIYLKNLVGSGKVFILYQKNSLGVPHLINLDEMPNLIFLGLKYYNYLLGPDYFKSYKDISLKELQSQVLQLISSNSHGTIIELSKFNEYVVTPLDDTLQSSINQLDWLLQFHTKKKN